MKENYFLMYDLWGKLKRAQTIFILFFIVCFFGSTEVSASVNSHTTKKPAFSLVKKKGTDTFKGNEGTQQLQKITGTVTDPAGTPMMGVTLVFKGTSVGTTTGPDGNFSISIPEGASVLVVSFVGFETQEITITTQTVLSVILKEKSETLDEVVVVGYGRQNKESVTAAISSVAAKELMQSPSANISNALAGRLSGLTSIQVSGKPGSDDADLYVRGVGTYAGTTAPLIMVDGVARESYNNIDPNEIESISILKDASATAVFGVRGANGVILITTKRGTEGKPTVSASAQTAIVQFTRIPKFLDSYDWASLFNEKAYEQYWIKHANDGWSSWEEFAASREAHWIDEATRYTSPQELELYKNGTNPYFYPNTDWQDLIFKKSSRLSQYNVNIDGGTEKVKYFVSIGYLDQGGLYNSSYFPFPDEMEFTKKRNNFRSNFDFDVNKDFRISVDIGTNFEKITGISEGNDDYLWRKRILWSNPTSSPGIIDDKFVVIQGAELAANNVLYEVADQDFNITNNNTLNSSVKGTYKLDFITEGLSINGRVAYDSYFSTRTGGGSYSPMLYRISPSAEGDSLNPVLSPLSEKSSLSYWGDDWLEDKWRKIYGEGSFNYKRTFGKHDISGLALYYIEGYINPDLQYGLKHGYIGSCGRVTYGFDKRYLAEFNVGYNGSENFPEDKRFDFFPAFSLGWVTTSEKFFPQNNILTYLKIRGSVGKVGNDNVLLYAWDPNSYMRFLYLPDVWEYSGGYTFGDYNNRSDIQGAIEGMVGNPYVTWEVATKSNIGFEAKLFSNKLSVTYDYFNELRKKILSKWLTTKGIVQANLSPANIGKVKNWGNEIEFTWRDKFSKVDYWIKGNASTNNNKIIFKDEAIIPGLEYQAETGRPINQPLYLKDEGLYNSWAELYEVDQNGNPVLSNPVLAKDKNGNSYTNASGDPVYQKDLGYGGAVLQPGEIKLDDVNEDGVIDDDDQIRTGKTNIPELTYGISMGFNLYGFDFSMMFQGVSGVARYVQTSESYHFSDNHSLQEVDKNRYTIERYEAGEQIDMPIAAYNVNAVNNTFFYKDASYVRLKNMEIGYTFTPTLLKKIGMSSARVYANGSNLLTWGKNRIWGDPENLGSIGYPITKTYNLGVNVNF